MKNEYDAHKALADSFAKKTSFLSQWERMSFSERLELSLELSPSKETIFGERVTKKVDKKRG